MRGDGACPGALASPGTPGVVPVSVPKVMWPEGAIEKPAKAPVVSPVNEAPAAGGEAGLAGTGAAVVGCTATATGGGAATVAARPAGASGGTVSSRAP